MFLPLLGGEGGLISNCFHKIVLKQIGQFQSSMRQSLCVSQGTQNRAGARDGRQDFLPEADFHARIISTSKVKLSEGNWGQNQDKPGYSGLNRDKNTIIFSVMRWPRKGAKNAKWKNSEAVVHFLFCAFCAFSRPFQFSYFVTRILNFCRLLSVCTWGESVFAHNQSHREWICKIVQPCYLD
jgi:hypothetical protein